MIPNPRRFITEDEVVGALHGIGTPVTTLEVARRLKVRATLVANRLSRLATYGKIARTHVTETSVGGTGLDRTYCLWSALPPSSAPCREALFRSGESGPIARAGCDGTETSQLCRHDGTPPGGSNSARTGTHTSTTPVRTVPSREGQADREA